MKRLAVLAHAKVNLTLDVLARRADGYHEIRSVILPISLADTLVFTPCLGVRLVTGGTFGSELPAPREDIIGLAARRLAEELGEAKAGCRVMVQKQLPLAAGLGGGSADAAATLVALNRLWGLGAGRSELARVASALGSDVPFCLDERPALASGRGEVLEPIRVARSLSLVLARPPVPKSTAEVYRSLLPDSMVSRPNQGAMLQALAEGDLEEIGAAMHNVLETVMIPRHPVIGALKSAFLQAGALGAVMTGAGPTVVGLARNGRHAQKIAAQLGEAAWTETAYTTTGNGVD